MKKAKVKTGYEEIEVDISDEAFLKIAKMAHERDITFNEMCIIILKEQLDKEKKENKDA